VYLSHGNWVVLGTKVRSSYGPLAYFSDIFISGKIWKRTMT
jgi:hypothetical protein